MMHSINESGEICDVNCKWLQETGYSREEVMGQSFDFLMTPESAAHAHQTVVPEFWQQGYAHNIPYQYLKKDGTVMDVLLNCVATTDPTGHPISLSVVQDVTQRKLAEAALRQAEEKYRSIVENAVEGIFQSTLEGYYLTANSMLARIYGYQSPDDLVNNLTDIQHQLYVDPERREDFRQLMQQQGYVQSFESQVFRKDGSMIWISESARAIRDETGEIIGYEGTVEDITARKSAEVRLYRRDVLLQGVAEATNHLLTEPNYDVAIAKMLAALGLATGVDRVYIYEHHPHPTTGDIAMSMRFEWTREGIVPTIQKPYWQNQSYENFGMGRWYETFTVGKSIKGIIQEFPASEREILQQDNIQSIIMVPIHIDGQCWGYIGFDDCQAERCWSRSEESILQAMAASIGGALKRQQAEATIRYQAFHDLLTNLPNRTLFNDHLLLALASARRHRTPLAVMFLDVDRFKTINDTLGHAAGDRLLQRITERLLSCLRGGDTIARWGGDEFTLLLPQITSIQDVANIAQRALEALKRPFHINMQELHVTSSIGIALFPQDGEDVETLLRNADAALYRAKDQGRNNYQFYLPTMNSTASALLVMENDLHRALERREFVLYYQPQVNIHTWKITGMEALLRWQHPERGLVSPQEFISLAEETGLIVPIGEWVLRTACAQNQAWQAAGLPPMRVSVNLSARQFQQPNLVTTVARILQETELAPKFLELEITETTVMQNIDFTSGMLHDLQQMGISLSMDDFGTGYSSLGYLKQFPLQTLKIDRSFVRDLKTSPKDAAIVTALVTLGQGLNLNVVAEGVETLEQLEKLRSLQCGEIQGFLFSPPLPVPEAAALIQNYSPCQD
ncbi:EAL domain-containing protein [Neosynechococcus sphagnicola]|uniref:bifunctional diguanylate cyclase/phosphodiesterase n=1 Tax=Neosynechococcus sphagnicola TaxID=1501145 RepID=UPI000AC2689B|nr:EAL domain-containing protein [Neosynechococcus sphagnicola]